MPSALVVGTNTYIDLVTATALLDDSIHAAQWPFVDPDNQTRALLTALRLLDLRTWEGTKTDPLQALQWPRTGAIDRFGQPVDTATVPAQIEQAQAQLAYLLSQNPTLEDAGGTGSNEKRLQAGSAEIEYFRNGDAVGARCTHHGYTFIEFKGRTTGPAPLPPAYTDREFWIKSSRAVGFAEKSYDFPPHVVMVKAGYRPIWREKVEGELKLLDSPWDPIAELLPMTGKASAYLAWMMPTLREITLEGKLDPDAFWPHVDTIGSSRWPGRMGGPRRRG